MSDEPNNQQWNVQPLFFFVANLQSGTSVNSEDRPCYADEIGVLKTSCVNGGRFNPSENKVIQEKSEILRAHLNPQKDSILISRMNTFDLVGESAYVSADFSNLFIPDRLWQTVMRPDVEVSVKWLSHVVRSPAFRQSVSNAATGTSGSMKNISQNSYLSLKVPTPPPAQQRKIARILTTVDNLIEKTEALIAKYQAMKKGMMHDLFTRGVDEHGHLRPPYEEAPELYKESELGWIPKEWEVTALGLHARLQGGFAFSSGCFREEGIPLIRISNIQESGLSHDDLVYLPESIFNQHSAFQGVCGDILIAMSGATTGKNARIFHYDLPVLINQRVGRFIITDPDALNSGFLYFTINSPEFQDEVVIDAIGGAQANISSRQVERISVRFPPRSEQIRISERMTAIESVINRLEAQAFKDRQRKTGLMQDLLTGKVRVKLDETEVVPHGKHETVF